MRAMQAIYKAKSVTHGAHMSQRQVVAIFMNSNSLPVLPVFHLKGSAKTA